MILKIFRIAIVLITVSSPAFSQPGGGDPPPAPITGIEWLLLAGGAFGAKKIYNNFKKRRTN